MSLPTDQTGSAEFDYSEEWLQFEVPELEGFDFDSFELPNLAQIESLVALEDPSAQTAVQSPNINLPSPSAQSQPRRTSVVTVRRRSSTKTNEATLSVTLEDPNGRKRSWDVDFDSAYEAWRAMTSAERVLASTQPQLATSAVHFPTFLDNQFSVDPLFSSMPSPIHAPQPTLPLDQQIAYLSGYLPALEPTYHITVPDLPMAPDTSTASTQMAAMPSRRPGRVLASGQNLSRRAQHPTGVAKRQKASNFPQPSRKRTQREGVGGRPPLPDDITLFVNPHHLPHNHGRVPDKRGNKDTTVANDYYYSISELDDLELPTCGETVSYNGIEFDAGLHFTSDEFLEYLDRASRRPNRQPILRIQIQPAQYNHRYMRAGQSFKCRFTDCPDKRGTILKGQARVCISEFNDEHGDWLNPFHNAGYVHLFCLEQQANLIALCDDHAGVTVVPETRSLVHEPPATGNMRQNNPMALNDVERAVVAEWLAEMGARWDAFKGLHRDPALRPAFELAQEDTLTYRLTKAHMDNRVLRTVQAKRKREAGGRVTAHLDEHVGDVGKQVALQKKMRTQPPKTKPGTGKTAPDAAPSDEPAAQKKAAHHSPVATA